jgi:hypothetical protein
MRPDLVLLLLEEAVEQLLSRLLERLRITLCAKPLACEVARDLVEASKRERSVTHRRLPLERSG